VLDFIRPIYEERLTARGRYLLWATALLAVLGLDTRRTQVFSLFAVAASALLLAAVFWLARAPRVRFSCPLPDHATSGSPIRLRARIEGPAGRRVSDLRLSFPRPRLWSSSKAFAPQENFLSPTDTASSPRRKVSPRERAALRMASRAGLRSPSIEWRNRSAAGPNSGSGLRWMAASAAVQAHSFRSVAE
jgi:hypothetical protein